MAFRVSDLSESVRENFIGVVIWAEYPCNCRVCGQEPPDAAPSVFVHDWNGLR